MWLLAVDFRLAFRIPASISGCQQCAWGCMCVFHKCVLDCVWLAKVTLDNQLHLRAWLVKCSSRGILSGVLSSYLHCQESVRSHCIWLYIQQALYFRNYLQLLGGKVWKVRKNHPLGSSCHCPLVPVVCATAEPCTGQFFLKANLFLHDIFM